MTKRSSTPPTDPSLATDADVYHAYRLILGRDPDPDGLAHYRHLITDGLTVDALARTFLHSDEHTQRIGQERRNDEAAIDLGGYQVIVRRSDPDFGADIAHWRVYEEPVRAALRELLTVGDTCLDVGANIGCHSIFSQQIHLHGFTASALLLGTGASEMPPDGSRQVA